jgi:hypothetical protein
MPAYIVFVPFEPLTYAALSSTATTQLPHTFNLVGINVSEDPTSGYTAVLQMEAASIREAKAMAVRQIEEFLALVAISNDGFRVQLSRVRADRIADDASNIAPSDGVKVDESGRRHYSRSLTASVEVEGSLGMAKTRGNVEFERLALSWNKQWPRWLRTALQLNYLAVASIDIKPAFLIRFSALEVLRDNILDQPTTVLKDQRLDPKKEKELLGRLRENLQGYGFANSSIDRLVAQIQNTQSQGNTDRIMAALQECAVTADKEDVILAVRQRGSIAHTGKSSDTYKAADVVRHWVQTALRVILETQKWKGS